MISKTFSNVVFHTVVQPIYSQAICIVAWWGFQLCKSKLLDTKYAKVDYV